MKYAMMLSVVGALALMAGCEETTPANSGGAGGASASSSSSSGDVSSSSGSSSSGMGGGTSTSSGMSSSSSSSTSTSSGKPMVCDNGMVVDQADPTKRCTGANNDMVANTVMAPANMVWADSADPAGFSSQYSPTDYGVIQATGAPDVYPDPGDQPKAWASQTTDDQDEFITVGFKGGVVAESVWVFETFNPGAISKITVKAMDGDHVVYTNATPKTVGACGHVLSVSTKTCSPITAVRIDVASKSIPGYNEIDAVGLLPAP